MGVRSTSTLDGLARDLEKIARRAPKDCDDAVKFVAKAAVPTARGFARERSGKHGKRYPRTITTERTAPAVWEVGPDSAMPQGGMSFEGGSRNQPPHHELADTADIAAPALKRATDRRVNRWFWNA